MALFIKHKGLVSVLLIGLLLRLAVLFTKGPWLTIASDDLGYINSALAFIKGHGITYTFIDEPTVHILPGVTFLLSPFFMFGQNDVSMTLVKLVMIAFGLISIGFTYAIGRYLFNRYVGWTAGFLLAIYVPQILSDNLVLTEAPITAAFLGFVYFSFRLADEPGMTWFYWVIGLYLFMLYFRPTIALLPIFLLIYFIMKKYPLKLAMKQFGIAAILLLLVMSPWWIRNYIHYNEFIPLSGGSGNPLLLGTYQGHGYKFTPTYKEVMAENWEAMKDETHYARQQAQKEIAEERMKLMFEASPENFLKTYTVLKTREQWSAPFYWIEIFGISTEDMNSVYRVGIVLLFTFTFMAGIIHKRRRKEWAFVILIIGYFTVLNNIFFAYPRYNQPLLPLLFIFGAAGVQGIWRFISLSSNSNLPHRRV